MFERVKLQKIGSRVWLMNDNDEGTGYLVTGSTGALVIDTMNGWEDVNAIARTVTDLPLTVVNTHGHPDHIYGNIYFKEAYLHPADMELARGFFADPRFRGEAEKRGLKPAAFRPVADGDTFDLGGLTLEVFELPGHTPGGICLLDRADRILFTGDSIIEQTWMQLDESLPMADFLAALEKLAAIRGEYDTILTGHSRGPEDASLYEAHKRAVREVCEGKNENDVPYEWFGGVCMAHPYGREPRRIVYNAQR